MSLLLLYVFTLQLPTCSRAPICGEVLLESVFARVYLLVCGISPLGLPLGMAVALLHAFSLVELV